MGYIAKPFDRTENNKQIAIGSRINTAIQLMPEFRCTHGRLTVHTGMGIDHWSNGSFQLPNLGLNYLSVNVGASYALATPVAEPPLRTLPDQREPRLCEWNVVGAFALNETGRPLSGQNGVVSVSGQRQWQVSPKSHLMAGIDLFNKGTLATVHPEMKERARIEYTQLGVTVATRSALARGSFSCKWELMSTRLWKMNRSSSTESAFGTGPASTWSGTSPSRATMPWHDHWEFGLGYRWN